MPLPSSRDTRWPTYAAWAAVMLFYIIVRVQLLDVPLDRDEGGYGYSGQAIWRGESPYRDFLDHKPPGLFYLFALAVKLVPATAAGLHSFLHVWNFLALIALAFVARRIAGPTAALWTAGIYSLTSIAPSVQGFTTSAEPLAIPPLAASLAVAVAAMGRTDRRRDVLMLVAGVLAAVSFLIKPTMALPLAATLLLIRGEGGARWKRDAATWVIGGATVGALIALCYAGNWKEFWYWNSTHNTYYRALSWDGWTGRLAMALNALVVDLGLPLLLAIGGCVWAFSKRNRNALFLIVFLVLSAVSCVQAGYLYLHYFAQVLAALALAAGVGASALLESVSRNPTVRRAVAIAMAAVIVAVPVLSRRWYWINPNPIAVSLQTLGPQAFEASPLIAEHLREKTGPDDTVWIFGNEPQIAYMAERRLASPFLFMYPKMFDFPRQREFQQHTWDVVQAAKPAYIVVTRERALMPRPPEMAPFLERMLETLRPSYPLESCLALMENDQLLLHTELDGRPCPGRPIIELWRRKP